MIFTLLANEILYIVLTFVGHWVIISEIYLVKIFYIKLKYSAEAKLI